jgi:hypothetical protein
MDITWQSFDNNLSVKFDTSQSKILSSMNPDNNENTDFLFPFKVVTLAWLITIGKYVKIDYHEGVTKNVDVYSSLFTANDKYIGLGALFLPVNKDPQTSYVLLIVNSEPYCKIKPNTYTVPFGDNLNVYYILANDDGLAGYSRIGTNIGNATTAGTIVFVKLEYLHIVGVVATIYFGSVDSPNGGSYFGWSPAIWNRRIDITTMFNNILLADATASPAWFRAFISDPYVLPSGFYFDIVPGQILGDCCNNRLTNILGDIGTAICGNYKATNTDGTCLTYMNNFCKGDNLQTQACYNFCSDPNNNCELALNQYCSDDQAYKKLDSNTYNNTCSCFLTAKYYDDWHNKSIQNLNQTTQDYLKKVLPVFKPKCSYPLCASGKSIQPHDNCPANAIQVCINQNMLKAGDVSNSSLSQDIVIACNQNFNPNPPNPNQPNVNPNNPPNTNVNPNPNNTPTTTKPTVSSQKTIIIGVIALVLLIIIGLAIYFLTRK